MPILIDVLGFIIGKRPGLTETQLAEAIFGIKNSYQQRANGDCRLLESRAKVHRRGLGGPGDPYTYFLGSATDYVGSLGSQ